MRLVPVRARTWCAGSRARACDDLAPVMDRQEFLGDAEPGVVAEAHVVADGDGHLWHFSFGPVEDEDDAHN